MVAIEQQKVNDIKTIEKPDLAGNKNIPGNIIKTITKKKLADNSNTLDNVENADKGVNDMITAESEYVYQPLYVYRRIEHSKRRITMYNSFAG